MTRISRINAPRATLAAFALLVIVMMGFGLFVGGADSLPDQAQVADEAVEQAKTETSQHCWMPNQFPLVAIDRRTASQDDVQL